MIIVFAYYTLQAPNIYSERWVRTVREEHLDHILIINEAYLCRKLKEFNEPITIAEDLPCCGTSSNRVSPGNPVAFLQLNHRFNYLCLAVKGEAQLFTHMQHPPVFSQDIRLDAGNAFGTAVAQQPPQ